MDVFAAAVVGTIAFACIVSIALNAEKTSREVKALRRMLEVALYESDSRSELTRAADALHAIEQNTRSGGQLR